MHLLAVLPTGLKSCSMLLFRPLSALMSSSIGLRPLLPRRTQTFQAPTLQNLEPQGLVPCSCPHTQLGFGQVVELLKAELSISIDIMCPHQVINLQVHMFLSLCWAVSVLRLFGR